jgi:hypothetical protein
MGILSYNVLSAVPVNSSVESILNVTDFLNVDSYSGVYFENYRLMAKQREPAIMK